MLLPLFPSLGTTGKWSDDAGSTAADVCPTMVDDMRVATVGCVTWMWRSCWTSGDGAVHDGRVDESCDAVVIVAGKDDGAILLPLSDGVIGIERDGLLLPWWDDVVVCNDMWIMMVPWSYRVQSLHILSNHLFWSHRSSFPQYVTIVVAVPMYNTCIIMWWIIVIMTESRCHISRERTTRHYSSVAHRHKLFIFSFVRCATFRCSHCLPICDHIVNNRDNV